MLANQLENNLEKLVKVDYGLVIHIPASHKLSTFVSKLQQPQNLICIDSTIITAFSKLTQWPS